MTEPYYWFGRNPPEDAETAWGARAIYVGDPPFIDLLPDRQGWRGEAGPARKALAAWVNAKGLPNIKEACVGLVGSSAEVVSWTDGSRVIEASPNRSYGHLYLVAYDNLSHDERIAQTIAKFPKTFGLRGFPGQRFSLSQRSSYVREGEVVLYTVTATGEDFAKGSPAEIRAEVVQ